MLLKYFLFSLELVNCLMFQHLVPASLPQLVRGLNKPFDGNLQVSNVLQKIGIEINEKGSTAYAKTITNLNDRFNPAIEFKANRPFLFLIIDETNGTFIFSGKVVRPAP